MSVSEESTLPPDFGRYRIQRLLGRGAMGEVYLAQDTLLHRRVALKTPRFQGANRDEQLRRFYQEARSAALLRHPNICAVFDVDEHAGVHYLSMAYLDGRPLSAYIVPGKPVPPRTAATLVRKLALALQHAHDQGILHRDLKPANIMMDRQREPIVMDFGLAGNLQAPADARQTRPATVMGTPAYMSPEQIRSDPDLGPAADLYSLGVVLYELVTSRVPFDGPVVAIMGQALTQEPTPPSELCRDVDPTLEAICLRLLRKKPEERYPSMQSLADALAAYLRSPPRQLAAHAGAVDAVAEETDPVFPRAAVRRHQESDPLVSTTIEAARPGSASHRGLIRSAVGVGVLVALAAVVWAVWLRPVGAIQFVFEGSVDAQSIALRLDNNAPVASGAALPASPGAHHVSVRLGDREFESASFEVNDRNRHVMSVELSDSRPVLRFDGRKVDVTEVKGPADLRQDQAPGVTSLRAADKKPQPAGMPEEAADNGSAEARRRQQRDAVRSGVPIERKNSLGATLVFVPAGTFLMGTKSEDLTSILLAARRDREPEWWLQQMPQETPQHTVRISRPFFLGRCEVTVGEFRAFVDATGYQTQAEKPLADGSNTGIGWSAAEKLPRGGTTWSWRNPGFPQEDSHPVCMIAWADAEAFCEWLSQKDNAAYRLPSEAEWEYACRAGTSTEWPTGTSAASLEGCANLLDQARIADFESVENSHTRELKLMARSWNDGFAATSPGGSFRPNGFGLCDMPGNVKEWCRDDRIIDWYRKSPEADPVARSDTQYRERSHRGGSFALTAGLSRSATRWWDPRPPVWYDQGFRVVCEIPQPATPE